MLSGCEFTFLENSDPIEISGYVTYENQPLENVKIVSDFYQYATTNSNGYYEFVTRSKNLVFYARKAGYSFIPKTYDITSPQENYNFEGEQARLLEGNLKLEQILIAPTSIVSIPGSNFEYLMESKSALKFHSFNFKINQTSNFVLTPNQDENLYLKKSSFTNILLDGTTFDYVLIDGKINLNFEFELKTFYKVSAFSEEVSIERTSIYKTNATLDTGDLDENNNIKFSIPSINSHSNGFTYNLQFVFKYTQN